MGRLWTNVETAAAHEFGRRHYRGVLALRVARAAALPTLVSLAAAALVVAAIRWGVPAVAHGAPVAAGWSLNLMPALIVSVIAVIGIPAALIAWHRWGWLLEIRAPWVTGRVASAAGSVLLVAAVAVVVWPH